MKKEQLKKIVKEEIKNALIESQQQIDYTDRNSGFISAVDELEELKNKIENLDLHQLANKKMIEYKYKRLGPLGAEASDAIDKLDIFIKFLTQDNSKILNKDGTVR